MSRRPGAAVPLRDDGGAMMAGIVMRSAQLERLGILKRLKQRKRSLRRIHERAILVGHFPDDGSVADECDVERSGVCCEIRGAVAALAADQGVLGVRRD